MISLKSSHFETLIETNPDNFKMSATIFSFMRSPTNIGGYDESFKLFITFTDFSLFSKL